MQQKNLRAAKKVSNQQFKSRFVGSDLVALFSVGGRNASIADEAEFKVWQTKKNKDLFLKRKAFRIDF